MEQPNVTVGIYLGSKRWLDVLGTVGLEPFLHLS